MKFNLLRVMCVVALWLPVLQNAKAQEYRQLTIDDFQGIPRSDGSGVIAYTNCTIDFQYKAVPENDHYKLNFDIRLLMNRDRSWMDKRRITSRVMLNEILKHEQGHYTIAYMEQQELLRTVSKTVFHADYRYQAQNIFDQIDAKYKQLNRDYDDDTRHMLNRVQQRSWNVFFQRKLAYMPPVQED